MAIYLEFKGGEMIQKKIDKEVENRVEKTILGIAATFHYALCDRDLYLPTIMTWTDLLSNRLKRCARAELRKKYRDQIESRVLKGVK